MGTFAQMLLAQSFRMADATLVLPIDFAKVVWGAMLGWWLFGEVVHPATFIGAIIIFSTATWITLRERNSGRNDDADKSNFNSNSNSNSKFNSKSNSKPDPDPVDE